MDKHARRAALLLLVLFGAESFADWDGTAVFLGDSITDFCDLGYYYPGLNAVNEGISGDVTGHMLERLDESVLAYEPDILVLLGGINDLYTGVSDDEIVANLTAIADGTLARFPDAAVLVQSIYPVADEPHPGHQQPAGGAGGGARLHLCGHVFRPVHSRRTTGRAVFLRRAAP